MNAVSQDAECLIRTVASQQDALFILEPFNVCKLHIVSTVPLKIQVKQQSVLRFVTFGEPEKAVNISLAKSIHSYALLITNRDPLHAADVYVSIR